jgi:hypothetical protein
MPARLGRARGRLSLQALSDALESGEIIAVVPAGGIRQQVIASTLAAGTPDGGWCAAPVHPVLERERPTS